MYVQSVNDVHVLQLYSKLLMH